MKSNLLSALVLGVSLIALTGCGDDKEQAVKSYESPKACQADIATDATEEERTKVMSDCQMAFDKAAVEHEASAPHYNTLGQCVDMYGADRCGLAHNGNGYAPLMTGFMLGYLAGGAPVYHPYYYDRWHTVYSGGTNLGYYRSGYVVASPGASWSRSYASTPITKGSPPPPLSATRGGFGGSAGAAAGRSVVSNSVSPSGRASSSSFTTPSSPAARGGFGSSAASAAGSSSG